MKQLDLVSQDKSGNQGTQIMATASNGRIQSVEFQSVEDSAKLSQ